MRSATSAAFTLLATLLVAGAATAQRPKPTQEQLIERRAKKLAKPVFQLADWMTDYDAARARAAEEDKLLFVYFTRSYSP